jgi:hypothetical protein
MCQDRCPKIETDILDRLALGLINAEGESETHRKLSTFELEIDMSEPLRCEE